MYVLPILWKTEIFCTILLALIAIIGDWLVKYSNLNTYKALFDNSTHSVIGGLTWFIINIRYKSKSTWIKFSEVILCALIASLIDLDHFIAAKSFRLKDATNLQIRPVLHCSTIPIVTTVILLILSKYFVSEFIYRVAWIQLAAFASHHIRDSTRRGLWFYYFGSTPPLPYFIYVTLTLIIPHVVAFLMTLFYVQNSTSNYYGTLINI